VQMYAALQRRGVRPGVDVGVVSCNDERSLVMGLDPALTTVNVRAEAVGRAAVSRLLWRMAHPTDETIARLLVEPALSERHSVPERKRPSVL
jgi:LacI family transcriptional regulator